MERCQGVGEETDPEYKVSATPIIRRRVIYDYSGGFMIFHRGQRFRRLSDYQSDVAFHLSSRPSAALDATRVALL